jgi:hypothetical protein
MVLVEGDALDPIVYQSLFNPSLCHIEPTFGKKNAINTVALLSKGGFDGVIAIVDDDYDTLNGVSATYENVFPTDTHDVETMIISSSAFKKYTLYLLPTSQHKYQEQFAKELIETAIRLCLPLGFIRWYFSRKNISSDFSSINFRNFIDVRNKSININHAINEVVSKNKDAIPYKDELLSEVQKHLKIGGFDHWLVCQGHDLVKVMYLILNGSLSMYAPKDKLEREKYFKSIEPLSGNEILVIKHLAMCYEKEEFRSTKIYSLIIGWEKKNPPYRVVN